MARIANYLMANNLQVSFPDLKCACFGTCEPPLAPNPKATSWFQAQRQSSDNVTSVLTYFKKNAVYIVIIGLVVILGLVGQY